VHVVKAALTAASNLHKVHVAVMAFMLYGRTAALAGYRARSASWRPRREETPGISNPYMARLTRRQAAVWQADKSSIG